MADIFISYAPEDRARAEHLAKALEEEGWSVWWDQRLEGGDVWDEVITSNLDNAKLVLVLWSATSVKTHWVKNEARFANEHQKLMPLRIEQVRIPIEFYHLHAEDLSAWQGDAADVNFTKVIRAIAKRFSRPVRESVQKELAILPERDQKLERLQQQKDKTVQIGPSNLVFVVMSFAPKMEVYYKAIESAARSNQLDALRIKDFPGDFHIMVEIINKIKISRFVVVDLTHGRPNVYYELGYARGLGKPIILNPAARCLPEGGIWLIA